MTLRGCSPWRLSYRADPAALVLADRHYSRQKPGSPQFVKPGRCLVLLTEDRSALWVTSWPFAQYVKHAWPGAWENSYFRNEGNHLSSELIRWAVAHTRAVWPVAPELGMVSFVNEKKVKDKEMPGWCYRRAGWSQVGRTGGAAGISAATGPEDQPAQRSHAPARTSSVLTGNLVWG